MTRRIAVLPSHVADQIAAGEVVERPASVVKELIENAIDAGARQVDIDVRDGGRVLMRVSDDGHGMEREDAAAALARHATSKIRDAADLVGVASFGFRGEALPAIASVSSLTLETSAADGEATVVRVVHGTVAEVVPGTRRRGTTVTVEGLFAAVPARRKFLRAARTEWRAIHDTVVSAAVLRRDVGFRVTNDGRQVIAWPAAATLRERLAAAWSADVAHSFIAVDDVRGPVRVHGLVERPADVGTATRRAWLAVNGRAIRDTGVVRAIESAFRTTIPAGVRPSFAIFIDLPGEDVDVNVHPAKAEVRFKDRWALERIVEAAVREALGTPGSVPGVRVWSTAPVTAPTSDIEVLRSRPAGPLFDGDRAGSGSVVGAPAPGHERTAASADRSDERASETLPELDIPPLVQVRRTWMMAERDDGVVLIDQHAAHERVLYERFMGALTRGDAPAQRLLFPLTLHLSPAEGEAFEANRELFERLGFEIEGFGGDTLLVNATPMPHPRFDAPRCLRESLAALSGDRHPSAHARHERLAATVACKAAVKAGDALSGGEMRALYADLARTALAPHDVHGRATIVLLSWDELERRFGRQ